MRRIASTESSANSRMAAAGVVPGARVRISRRELVLDLLIAVGDQLVLGREVVVDGLFGDLGFTRNIADRDLLIAALRRTAARRRRR